MMNLTVSPTNLQSRDEPVHFSGRGKTFLWLALKGSLLQIPTFGFYRFWLTTHIRRHLWANTRVGDDAFEYVGTARELLIGFLIAIAILMPVYIGFSILGLIVESIQPFTSVGVFVVMWILSHFASYRARRYRVSRTTFRGLRFWMTGAGWAYTLRAVAWDIVIVLTLGLALPWAAASLERYRMRHTYFGTLQGGFTGTGWGLFKSAWWMWLGLMITALASGGILYAVRGRTGSELASIVVPLLVILFLVSVPLLVIFRSISTRWHFSNLRMGDVSVTSNLDRGAFFAPLLKMIGANIGLTVLFGLVIFLMVLLVSLVNAPLLGSFRADKPQHLLLVSAAAAPAYLLWFLGLGVIKRYFVDRGLWLVTVNSLSVSNMAALDNALMAGEASGAIGEGFADALDFEFGI